MKQLFLILASVLLISLSGYSQVENPVLPSSARFLPGNDDAESPYTMNSINDVITVEFDVQPNVPATVVYSHVYYEGAEVRVLFNYEFVEVIDKKIQIRLDSEKWGEPYDSLYNLELSVTFGYEYTDNSGRVNYEYYLNDSGEPFLEERSYLLQDNSPARLLYYAPNNSMFNENVTFKSAYDYGIMDLNFTKEITSPETVALVSFYDEYGDLIFFFNSQIISQGWKDGLYRVSFRFSETYFSADEIGTIEIRMNPVKWYNPDTGADELISIEPIILENKDSQYRRIRRNPTTGIERSLIENNSLADVYDISGRIVKEQYPVNEIRNLAPGIYIANGKKYVVR